MSLPIPVVFFSSNFPVRKIYAIEKLTGLGKCLQTTSFKWMEQNPGWKGYNANPGLINPYSDY